MTTETRTSHTPGSTLRQIAERNEYVLSGPTRRRLLDCAEQADALLAVCERLRQWESIGPKLVEAMKPFASIADSLDECAAKSGVRNKYTSPDSPMIVRYEQCTKARSALALAAPLMENVTADDAIREACEK